MFLKNVSAWLFALLFIGVSFISANAQGVIIPIICDRVPRCPPIPRPRPVQLPNVLPVKSIKLDTKINGQVATTHVEQIFRNDSDFTLEGTYFFPIPETASIVEFAIWENDKKLVGEVRSREEARRIYDEIVRRQRDPGLLEYAGKDLFQASIFPIPPRSDKKLELTYTQVLKGDSGTISYRYPLGTGGNLWRNPQPIPMMEGDVVRSGTRLPPTPIGTVSGRIEIQSNSPLRNIYSPSHSVDIRKSGDNKAVLTFESSSKNEQNDFQLFYGLSKEDFGMSLVTYRETAKDGYFLLTLSPKENIAEADLVAKDVVFVIDTSGSMNDAGKIEKARSALLFGVKSLRSADKFNVISFSGEEHLMESGLIAADEAGKRRGEQFVSKLQATGGTNINDSMIAALKQFKNSDRPKILVFLTDGLPTVGETNVQKIVQNAAKIKLEGVRIFTFGVGYDVNTQLLNVLATENGGLPEYVEPKEDLEIKVSAFFEKISSPVLTDLDLDFGGVETDLMYPRKMPDLFKGSQLTIIGRYKNSRDLRETTLTLRGKTGRENRSFFYQNLAFPLRAEDNSFIPRLWATRRVGWLTEQIRNNGEQRELRDEIVELGTRYGIVTPYTSYLAVAEGENKRADGSGFSMSARKMERMPAAKSRPMTVDGRDAVLASKTAQAQQGSVTISADSPTDDKDQIVDTTVVRKVGAKTFYLENGVWTDSEFKEEAKLPEIKLNFASDAYFDLLKQEKDLAQYFALGKNVVIVFKGKVYRISG